MKAWILPSTRAIWSRQAWVASRAETSRRESLAVSSEIVSWLSMAGLLDDFGDDEQAAGRARRIAEGVFMRQRRTDFIRPRHVDHRHRVRRRLDVGDVQLAQRF